MFSWKKLLPRRKPLSLGKWSPKRAVLQGGSELRELRADLAQARTDIRDLERQVSIARVLLWAAERDKEVLQVQFRATKLKLEEENQRLRANVLLAIEQEDELREDREKTQRNLLSRLDTILQARQKAKSKSWWRRLPCRNAVLQAGSELREARADLERALSDIADRKALLAEAQELLRAEKADIAALQAEFQAMKWNLKEENQWLRELLGMDGMYYVRIAIEQEAEQRDGKEKAKNKSWWRRLGW